MNILVHIVTWRSSFESLSQTIESVLNQEDAGKISLEITDNGLCDGDNSASKSQLESIERAFPGIRIFHNRQNLGFCAAHNQAVARFIEGDYAFLLVLNPDAFLTPGCLGALIEKLSSEERIGSATPKLIRCDSCGQPSMPPIIDAAGMSLTDALRHFDRGAESVDNGTWDKNELVFGGTGACLLLKRQCIEDMIFFDDDASARDLNFVFPQLATTHSERRPQLFDEAFFAFREDADLAWRMQTRGWGCVYVPSALAYHVRRVTPERRSSLPAEINLHSIRNRFLLQFNNLPLHMPLRVFARGFLWRNALVLAGVLFKERSSLPALRQVVRLSHRAIKNRRSLVRRNGSDISRGVTWITRD